MVENPTPEEGRQIQSSSPRPQKSDLSLAPELSPTTLPADQQAQLNRVSQDLLDKLSEGPSSLIDQNVMKVINELPEPGQMTFWEIVGSPRQAYKLLAADGKKREAQANLQTSIADTALTVAKLAEQDLNRKVFEVFIQSLRNNEGQYMEVFCKEQRVKVPEEGTVEEKIMLIRMHAINLGLEAYREKLQEKWEEFVKNKAEREGDIAISNENNRLLPQLIEARATENPLKQELHFQKVSHVSAMVVGTPVAAASGALGGASAAVVYGLKSGWDTMKKKFLGDNAKEDDKKYKITTP